MYSDLEFRESAGFQAKLAEIAQRTMAETAQRICDDAENWDWRAYLRDRA